MFEHEIRKTINIDLVNICIKENLDKKFWKHQNNKVFNQMLEETKDITIKSIYELPKFALCVAKYERLWNKHRSQFNVMEMEYIEKNYLK